MNRTRFLLSISLVISSLSVALAQAPVPSPAPSPPPTVTPPPPPADNNRSGDLSSASVKLGIPKDLSQGKTAQIQVTATTPLDGTLSITLPPGFQSQQTSYEVPRSDKPHVWIFNVTPPARNQVVENGVVQARLVQPGKPSALLASDTATLRYRIGQSLTSYYLYGLLGIMIGYAMRKVMKAFSETPPPDETIRLMTAEEPVPGWLKKFVAKHYYLVDALITLVIGGLALYKLVTSDQRLPEDGLFPMGAIVLGFFIGLLTHSELATRLSAKGAAKLARAWS